MVEKILCFDKVRELCFENNQQNASNSNLIKSTIEQNKKENLNNIKTSNQVKISQQATETEMDLNDAIGNKLETTTTENEKNRQSETSGNSLINP